MAKHATPVRDEAGVDEVEYGVEGVPEEVPAPTETPSAPRRSTRHRLRSHDAPRSDSMHIAHLRIPPKRAVLVVLRRLVRDAPQSVRDDDEHMHLRYDVDCPARDHIMYQKRGQQGRQQRGVCMYQLFFAARPLPPYATGNHRAQTKGAMTRCIRVNTRKAP